MDAGVDGLSIKEAAERLGVSTKTVRRRIIAGDLKAHKLFTVKGYEWRVDLDIPAVSAVTAPQVESPLRAEMEALRADVAALRALLTAREIRPVPEPVEFAREEIPCEPGQGQGQVDEGRRRGFWSWLWGERN